MPSLNRRTFLGRTLAGAGLASAGTWPIHSIAAARRARLPVAGVVTVYTHNSHADVILGKILAGWRQDGGPGPDLNLVSLYVDQRPEGDLSRGLAEKHGFRLAGSIDEALTLGGDRLAVAGVLNIGEHGSYPEIPETHQVTYPRRRFFDEVTATFRRCKQVVPVFNDKHLSYNWADARHMYDTARELSVPFLAGSSAPVAWRVPPLSLPIGCEITEAMALGYGGLEAYGFHAMEVLQAMVERRGSGETGVAAVDVVRGEGIWAAEREGRWSRKLFDAMLAAVPPYREGRPEDLLTEDAAFYLIEYRDGLKATVAMANGLASQFAFAATLAGQTEPAVTWYELEENEPFGHFEYLLRAIEHMIHTGKPPYPVERTLLTTGVLDAALHSLAEGKRLETPQLDVAYQPADWPFAPGRPMAAK